MNRSTGPRVPPRATGIGRRRPLLERLLFDQEGLSLVSAIVALGLATVVILGMGHTLAAGLRSTQHAKRVQLANALATKAIETARGFSYDGLLLCTSDTTGDPNIVAGKFDPDDSGGLPPESVAHVATGCGIDRNPPLATVSSTRFTVLQYVTWVDENSDSDSDYKRFTVLVSWGDGGVQRVSTLISPNQQRGLPTPKFEVTPVEQEQTVVLVDPRPQITFAHAVQNLGAPDAYDITAAPPPGRSWSIRLYQDVDEDQTYDEGTDTILVDTNGNSTVDTGNVATNEAKHFLIVWQLQTEDATGTEQVELTVASGIDPGETKTATDTLVIDVGGGVRVYLHNDPSPPTRDTNAQLNMSMDPASPTATTLYTYSKNVYNAYPGRFTDKSTPSPTQSSDTTMVNWIYQVPQHTALQGNATVRFWAALKDLKCDKTPSFTIYLREKTSATTTSGTALVSPTTVTSSPPGSTAPCDFRQVDATLSGPLNTTVAKDRFIELKIVVNDSTGDAALTAYDTTTYDSHLRLPVVTT